MTSYTLFEKAVITLERPERYGKQLASHISHKTVVEEIEGGWQAEIRNGQGRILLSEGKLILEAHANDVETLATVKDVLGRHLLQFTTKLAPFVITWAAA